MKDRQQRRGKINSKYKFREIAGCYYVITLGEAEEMLKNSFKLTETAAWIWKRVELGIPAEEIAQKIMNAYNIKLPQAMDAVKQFLSELRRQGLLSQE